jgi:hypothetical protein
VLSIVGWLGVPPSARAARLASIVCRIQNMARGHMVCNFNLLCANYATTFKASNRFVDTLLFSCKWRPVHQFHAEKRIPSYPLAEGDFLYAIEHSGSFTATATDVDGEYFAMAMAWILPVSEVASDAIIVVPLTPLAADGKLNFNTLGSMFVQLVAKPRTLCTYGLCIAYSAGTTDSQTLADWRFPAVASYILAQRDLSEPLEDQMWTSPLRWRLRSVSASDSWERMVS